MRSLNGLHWKVHRGERKIRQKEKRRERERERDGKRANEQLDGFLSTLSEKDTEIIINHFTLQEMVMLAKMDRQDERRIQSYHQSVSK